MSAAVLAKVKVTGVVAAALAAGGVGGAVALSQVAPGAHVVRDLGTASTSDDGRPGGEAPPATGDTTADAPDGNGPGSNPGRSNVRGTGRSSPAADGNDRRTAEEVRRDGAGAGEHADARGSGDSAPAATGCATKAAHHGEVVASTARSATTGKGAGHGTSTSGVARDTCGKHHGGAPAPDDPPNAPTTGAATTGAAGTGAAPAPQASPAPGHGHPPEGHGPTRHAGGGSGPDDDNTAGAPGRHGGH